MKPAFTHCALHVRDLDQSIAFYRSYCGLETVKEHGEGEGRVAWLASPGEEDNFVLVLLGGGAPREQDKDDMTHYGFGVPAREDVDRIAERGRREGCLHWEPRDSAPPTGYLCAVKDPSGYIIEFSYGQPLGPHQE
ncbi:MAG: VOC family protein [Methyloceanibacter sp.]|nr:VOC family protein [Methyloceanibacter sp.]